MTALIVNLKPNLYFKRGEISFLDEFLLSSPYDLTQQDSVGNLKEILVKLTESGYDIKRMWELGDHHIFVRYYITQDNTLNTGCWMDS